MPTDLSNFPPLLAAVQDGIDRRMHTGVQIYASLNGEVIVDCGFGLEAPDRPMHRYSNMLWRSAGKPLTALLVLKQAEQGRLSLQSTLSDLLPESSGTDKSAVTLEQLLTHTSGFPTIATGWPESTWDESINSILNAPRQLPTGTAAYHPLSSWFLLAEILLRADSSSVKPSSNFAELIRNQLLQPLGMDRSSCGLPVAVDQHQLHQIPVLYERNAGRLVESSYNGTAYRTRLAPGGSLRGPVRDLGRFYELLCREGLLADGTSFVSSSTIAHMTARQRANQYDQTFQHVVDFGLGVIVDSNYSGIDTVPYGFGRFCSSSTFGHGGSQCAMGFCDPERKLVVAWAANGFCGEGQHQRRNRAINEAIYQIL